MRANLGVLAVVYGMSASLGYTAANVCLRSVADLDPVWVSCMKALPTVLAVLPLLVFRWTRAQALFPSWTLVGLVVGAALIGQIGGNVLFQWSLSVIGLAFDVPLTLGTMIVSGAILGRWLLGDPITSRIAIAASLLIAAIGVLGLGASKSQPSVAIDAERSATENRETDREPGRHVATVLGVAAACVSGVAYSVLSVMIRYASNQGTPQASILGTVCLVGFVGLGTLTLVRSGIQPLVTPSTTQYALMLLGGIFNYFAFLALTKALHLSSVFFVNTLNASQSAMSAVAGVLIFGEPLSWELTCGLSMTIAGLFLMRGKKRIEVEP
jgi:drug/metabolite transporter (DMT)-like permease